MALILVIGAITALVAWRSPQARQSQVLACGSLLAIAAGMLGMATGLQMVAANYQRFSDPLAMLATGLRELSYNGVFAAIVGGSLAIASLVRAATSVQPQNSPQ